MADLGSEHPSVTADAAGEAVECAVAGPHTEHPRAAERAVAAQLAFAEGVQHGVLADELGDPAVARRLGS